MGNYAGANNWQEDVYQFEQTDVVQGGADGIDNLPLKQLADRTTFLKAALRGYYGVTVVNAAKSLTVEEVNNKLVLITGTTAFTITLPGLDSALAGLKISFVSQNAKQITIAATVKVSGDVAKTSLIIAEGEKIELIFDGTALHLLDHSSNLFTVGDFGYGYALKKNAVAANGALLLRTDYPRLFEYVQGLGSSIVSDLTWNTVAGYKGFFTLGTNSTNFRVPDLRSMFIRGLDLGAGLTYARNTPNPGGYEADEIKSHTHNLLFPGNRSDVYGANIPSGRGVDGWEAYGPTDMPTQNAGGTETRPKNIGLIPYLLV